MEVAGTILKRRLYCTVYAQYILYVKRKECLGPHFTVLSWDPERKGKGGNRGEYRSESRVKNTECTQEIGYLQSVNTDKYLPQSPFTGIFLRFL